MIGTPGDSPAVSQATDHDVLTAQTALSQHVQALALNDALQAAVSAAGKEQAPAPKSEWGKFAAVTHKGVSDIPQGVLHAVSNPALALNAAVSVGFGIAARKFLPESSLFAKLLGIGFAAEAAKPIGTAYWRGMHAKTLGDINCAGADLGNALGGLAVNIPIGIAFYKLGGGIYSKVSGSAVARGGSAASDCAAATEAAESRLGKVTTAPAPGFPSLPQRYLPIKENFSGRQVPGISRQFLKNLKTDPDGNYYGAGEPYPDIMSDPQMKAYIEGHNQATMARIDPAVYRQQLADEAKAGGAFGQPPKGWYGGHTTKLEAIDVTDGGDGQMQVGSQTIKVTDEGAPNRKVVTTDALGRSKVLIAEPADFEIQQVIHVDANGAGRYVVVGSQDGASVLRIYDEGGKDVNQVQLPVYGTLHDVKAGATPSQLQFVFDNPGLPPHSLTVDAASGQTQLAALPGYNFNAADYITEKIKVPYTDIEGNVKEVPTFITHAKNAVRNGKNLAMLNIYGGFDVGPQYLRYMPHSASWLMRGDVVVDPVLPGDGGLGALNYEEGLLKGIQNTDRAVTAIVGKLQEMGLSSPELTGVYGRSNGGMVVNTLLNADGDRFGAAVTESGVNSLFDSPVINAGTGRYWIDEFGDPQDPRQVPWMSQIDPLNNLSASKRYPPTLVEIGTIDGIVNTGNGITLAHIRQGMNNGETLLYSRIGEGHDPASLALQTAFLRDRLSEARRNMAPSKQGVA